MFKIKYIDPNLLIITFPKKIYTLAEKQIKAPKGKRVLRLAFLNSKSPRPMMVPKITAIYKTTTLATAPKTKPTRNINLPSPKPSHFPFDKNQTAEKNNK
jgi:hypothetical protein